MKEENCELLVLESEGEVEDFFFNNRKVKRRYHGWMVKWMDGKTHRQIVEQSLMSMLHQKA